MRSKRQQGVILIICLWLLAALSLLVVGLAHRLRLEGRIIGYRTRRETMLELGRAAVTLAQTRLERASGECTFYGEQWARPIRLDESFFGELAATGLGRYRVDAMVYDECGKLNLNAAYRSQLRMLQPIDDEIASAIIDWRDEDEVPSSMGAEDSYYHMLKPRRACKDAPFDSAHELLLVRGITPEMYFGAGDGAVSAPETGLLSEGAAPGLRDLLTCYGSGGINLNTAPYAVLLAVPGVTGEMAANILYRRSGADGIERTADDVAFQTIEELEEVGAVTEFARQQIAAYCVLASDTYCVRARVTDTSASGSLGIDAVFVRTDSGVNCISWRER